MITRENKLRNELNAWKETAEILADKKIMLSIQKSLKEIARGKSIPASEL